MKTRRVAWMFPFALSLALAAPLSARELRMAVVNLPQVVKAYPKAQEAEAQMESRADTYRAELETMGERLKELGRETSAARDEAANPALSEAAREKKRDVAVQKLTALKEAELEIRQRKAEIERLLGEQNRRVRETVLEELRQAVSAFAREAGYDLVIDSITVLHHSDQVVDITDALIKKMQD